MVLLFIHWHIIGVLWNTVEGLKEMVSSANTVACVAVGMYNKAGIVLAVLVWYVGFLAKKCNLFLDWSTVVYLVENWST